MSIVSGSVKKTLIERVEKVMVKESNGQMVQVTEIEEIVSETVEVFEPVEVFENDTGMTDLN